MIVPGPLTLRAWRNITFRWRLEFRGINLFGAGLLMQVRLYPDAPGAALLSLEPVADILTQQGLFITVDNSGTFPISTVEINILRGNLQAMPVQTPDGDRRASVFSVDLMTTGINFTEGLLAIGDFILNPNTSKLP